MSYASDRPLFIAVFTGDVQGCGFHRCVSPSHFLNSVGAAHVIVNTAVWAPEWFKEAKPDVVVWQRFVEEEGIARMREAKKQWPHAFHIYEVDDVLDRIPERNFHSAAVPANIGDRIREAIAICDAVTTTTDPIKEWLRDSMGAKDIRVVPNLLPTSFFKDHKQSESRVRVGWAGGISHAGDLDIIREAMNTVKDAVDWVFIGMTPEGDLPVKVEFHSPVAINAYMDKLHSLNIDLMLAPLEMNEFNAGKSNLRILEAAAVNAAVIATPFGPYEESSPPLYAYATTAQEWADQILSFVNSSADERKRSADRITSWAKKKYTYESQKLLRVKSWLPAGVLPWKVDSEDRRNGLVIVSQGSLENVAPFIVAQADKVRSLAEGCKRAMESGKDVLYVRPGTTLTEGAMGTIRAAMIERGNTACVFPIGSDGPGSFPSENTATPMDAEKTITVDNIVRQKFKGRRGMSGMVSGPVVLLSGRALRMIGAPDEEGYGGRADIAIAEWACRATEMGLQSFQILDAYAGSLASQSQMSQEDVMRIQLRDLAKCFRIPIDGLKTEDREALELQIIRDEWRGVRPGTAGLGKDYVTWASLMPMPPEHPLDMLDSNDAVHVVEFGDPLPSDGWVIFKHKNINLRPEAAYIFSQKIAEDVYCSGTILYADHDIQTLDGKVYPYLKGDFDETLFEGNDYVTQICAIRAFDAQAYGIKSRIDLFRFALNYQPIHVPYVLGIVKEENDSSAQKYGEERLKVLNRSGKTFELCKNLESKGFIRRISPKKSHMTTTVIVLSDGDGWNIQPCLKSILTFTKGSFPIVVLAKAILDKGEYADSDQVMFIEGEDAVGLASLNVLIWNLETDAVLLTTDRLRVGTPDWLAHMVGRLGSGVDAVGAHILHANNTVLHSGGSIIDDMPAFQMAGASADWMGYQGTCAMAHRASFATKECMAFLVASFKNAGGFDVEFSSLFDADICLRMKGDVVIETAAMVQHAAGPPQYSPDEMIRFRKKHKGYKDPWISEHFATDQSRKIMFDQFSWKPPTFKNQERIILINDAVDPAQVSEVLSYESRRGNVTFRSILDGFNLILIGPAPTNIKAWDIRDYKSVVRVLNALAIDRIVFASIIGPGAVSAGVEAVRMFTALPIHVDFLGGPVPMLCPRLDMHVDGKPCGEGYKNGVAYCQSCVDKNGSPVGMVDVKSWLDTWNGFVSKVLSKAA